MGRSVLIYVAGAFVILSIAMLNANRSVDNAGTQSASNMHTTIARNICNSMTSVLLSRIADSTSLRYETAVTEPFMGGTVTYQVKSVGSVGNITNDDHQSNEHESDDHGDDHSSDHSDDHGDDHSANFDSGDFSKNNSAYVASIFAAFNASSALFASDDDHGDDHSSDDHGDDHSSDDHSDDHSGDDHGDGHHHEDNESDGDTIKVVVSATYASNTQTMTTYIAIAPPANTTRPEAVQGGFASRGGISTSGNMQIDGRNHNLSGDLVAGSGRYGIWTTASYSQGGSSDVGGTYSGTDYAPSKPANSHVIKTSASLSSGSFPDTPDKVFGGSSAGFPEGTLKSIAQSGSNGGQYVTNPSLLTSPLSGVTYVELPNSGTWQSMDISGTGVLIVHNANGNAIFKNLNSGTFKGIIVADDIIHIHTTIIGAVVGIGSSSSEGNYVGNGNGSILYSEDAITQALTTTSREEPNYGFGKTRLNVIGWYN